MRVRRILTIGPAALAACGVLGVAPAAAQASSGPGSVWAEQAPAASPSPRFNAQMAYDTATGTVVLFGGQRKTNERPYNDTWTWNGTNWKLKNPAISPHPRYGAAFAYDPATRTVVMFSGERSTVPDSFPVEGTWTWDGSTWTLRHPAASPPARGYATMAYDAATGTEVLFGGYRNHGVGINQVFGDTWTWDGTTWTEQHPAASPPARYGATMAYDAATGTVVLFGGQDHTGVLGDTWTWDGSTWTEQHPATSPPARDSAAMAYDAASHSVVLFGGGTGGGLSSLLSDTWTWDGTTWKQQQRAVHPHPRNDASMAYDAATRTAVLFGGIPRFAHPGVGLSQTWTWGRP